MKGGLMKPVANAWSYHSLNHARNFVSCPDSVLRLSAFIDDLLCPASFRSPDERLEAHSAQVLCRREDVPGTVVVPEEEQQDRTIGTPDFDANPASQTVLRTMQREHTDRQRACRCQ